MGLRKKFHIILALAWLMCCNIAVAEALFISIGHIDDTHSHSVPEHDHHTDHHPGHAADHQHSEDADPHSHGKDFPTSFTSSQSQHLSSISVYKSFKLQPWSVSFSYNFPPQVVNKVLPYALEPPDSWSSILLTSLTISPNAPPFLA